MILWRMLFFFLVKTNKMCYYRYNKLWSQCPFTGRDNLWNNFFHSNTQIHCMHCIWCVGKPPACPSHTPHNNHVSYHNWASRMPIFSFQIDWGTKYVNDFPFFDTAVQADDNGHPTFRGCTQRWWKIVLPFSKLKT